MATDKDLLNAFREQFNTGRLFNESQVLVLMGYARGDEKKKMVDARGPGTSAGLPAFKCPYCDAFCPYIDTSGNEKTMNCLECENYTC